MANQHVDAYGRVHSGPPLKRHTLKRHALKGDSPKGDAPLTGDGARRQAPHVNHRTRQRQKETEKRVATVTDSRNDSPN